MTREAEIRQTASEWLRYNHPTCTQDMLVEAFRCGAEWADKHQPSLWISVNDRLPEEDPRKKGYSVEVLGLLQNGRIGECYYSFFYCKWYMKRFLGTVKPTHWIPIPEVNP